LWIITAWQHIYISPIVVAKGFKECCISNGMDGTDDMLWNGSEEDGNVKSYCEEDEGSDCEDRDNDTDW
jgi:hypothetical protein